MSKARENDEGDPEVVEYRAMTVNERLFVADLLDEFDVAARSRDRRTLLGILSRVQMTPEQAEGTVGALLDDPAKYGF